MVTDIIGHCSAALPRGSPISTNVVARLRPVCERALTAERVEYEMAHAESELLLAATKDALAAAGALGGSLGSDDMVPALVRVQIEPVAAGGSRVHVRATGREGLIKQAIGAKAVDRICEAIARHAP